MAGWLENLLEDPIDNLVVYSDDGSITVHEARPNDRRVTALAEEAAGLDAEEARLQERQAQLLCDSEAW